MNSQHAISASFLSRASSILKAAPTREPTVARILVIEKDDGVREFVVRALSEIAHEVQGARSILVAAVALPGAEIDLVILSASGGDYSDQLHLAREVRSVWRSHVLITSGAWTVASRLVEYDSFVFLPKPFTTRELVAGVNRALAV